jgi:hypothetical protein
MVLWSWRREYAAPVTGREEGEAGEGGTATVASATHALHIQTRRASTVFIAIIRLI